MTLSTLMKSVAQTYATAYSPAYQHNCRMFDLLCAKSHRAAKLGFYGQAKVLEIAAWTYLEANLAMLRDGERKEVA